jgi:hypothetical protein
MWTSILPPTTLGIDVDLFTPSSRSRESADGPRTSSNSSTINRLIRPRADYIGRSAHKKYVAVETLGTLVGAGRPRPATCLDPSTSLRAGLRDARRSIIPQWSLSLSHLRPLGVPYRRNQAARLCGNREVGKNWHPSAARSFHRAVPGSFTGRPLQGGGYEYLFACSHRS